jgi:predicted SpoU family rRNA methylase
MNTLDIQLHEIDHVWPHIMHLEEFAENGADVLQELQAGNAKLTVLVDDRKLAGFYIGYPQPDGGFFVWVGHLHKGHDLAEGFEHIRATARALGCSRIIFGSERKGWERVARKHGFRPSYWEQAL